MTGLVSILLLSVVILILAIRLVARSWSARPIKTATVEDYAKAREALDLVFIETAAIRRILAAEDQDFVSRTGPRDVQHLFSQERRALAQKWLRNEQKRVARLMDLHLRLASYTYDPSPRLELRLTAQYFAFAVVSNFVLLLLWLVGPFQATRIVEYTARTAANFCAVFSLRLDQIDPTRLGSREYLVH